jgi:FAD/FMN-containing dehydrogenase
VFSADRKEKLKDRLASIVGPDNFADDEHSLDRYSKDQSFTSLQRPDFVLEPATREEVQEIVSVANEDKVPVVPVSSGTHFFGAAIPSRGGIVVDLKRMNRILLVNTREWNTTIEAGVTYRQLAEELDREGFRIATPLFALPSASAVSTLIQRNHPTTATDFSYGNELIMGYELVLPNGDHFNVGKQAVGGPMKYVAQPTGPGLNFWRLFQGACGTLGIVTSMAVKILKKPKLRKVHFWPCKDLEEAVKVIRITQRRELGLECFALNRFNLAVFVLSCDRDERKALEEGTYVGECGAPRWSDAQRAEFQKLLGLLPPWMVVIVSSGFERRPEEKIAYEEEDLKELGSKEIGVDPEEEVRGVPDLAEELLKDTERPTRMQKRFGFKGSVQPLSFYGESRKASFFEGLIHKMASEFGVPFEEIGGFILPIERARAVFCQFDLHCDSGNAQEKEKTETLLKVASERLIDEGAFFDPPYGIWADMMYSRAGTYAEYLKRVKKELDPNGIMNPGKLCF